VNAACEGGWYGLLWNGMEAGACLVFVRSDIIVSYKLISIVLLLSLSLISISC